MTDLAWMKTYIGTETALTGHLTAEEFGAYERLRRHYWQHSRLPDEDARLMRITGVDPDRWEAMANAIRPLLAEALPRLDQERSVAAGKREKKVAAGRKGAEARWQTDSRGNAVANGKGMANAMAKPMRNQWPSASASDEVRYEERLASTRTRETDQSDTAFDPPETAEEGYHWLSEQGVPHEEIEPLLHRLMAWRLYRSDLAKYRRDA